MKVRGDATVTNIGGQPIREVVFHEGGDGVVALLEQRPWKPVASGIGRLGNEGDIRLQGQLRPEALGVVVLGDDIEGPAQGSGHFDPPRPAPEMAGRQETLRRESLRARVIRVAAWKSSGLVRTQARKPLISGSARRTSISARRRAISASL